jgi:CHASE2 domain-containing sensor protein
MPESPRVANKQLVAIILMISAALLAGAAMLIYTGIVPVQPDARGMIALVVAVAAVADFGVGLMFFRMGQSS